MNNNKKQSILAVLLFPILIILASLIGIYNPRISLAINPYVIYMLGIIMFTMGLTIKVEDLKNILHMPQAILIGCVAQFTIMPLFAWLVSLIFGLSPLMTVGMVILGAAPGGASSNIVAYLAKGNVALSISMTSVSTLLAPILTPVLIWAFAGKLIHIDFISIFFQVLKMVLIPVLLGISCRAYFSHFINKITPYISWFSILILCVLITGIMSGSKQYLTGSIITVFFAVVVHNFFGFTFGYLVAYLCKIKYKESRTIAIEVGMQNAGLAAALASTNFGGVSIIPASIATIWHNIAGAIVAFLFNQIGNKKHDEL